MYKSIFFLTETPGLTDVNLIYMLYSSYIKYTLLGHGVVPVFLIDNVFLITGVYWFTISGSYLVSFWIQALMCYKS